MLRITIICLGLVFAPAACSQLSSQNGPKPSPTEVFPGRNGWEPKVACEHLSDKLTPGLYKNEGANGFRCLSSAKDLGGGSPANNIVYFARGEAARVRQVGLILNVNNPESAQDALQTLVDYSDALSKQALGVPLSNSATKAMLAGNPGRGTVDTTKVEVLRHNFSNGKGFELHYVITPRW